MFAHYFNKTPMLVFYEKVALIKHLNAIKTTFSTLGFVPTMGALHQGHLALMQRSIKEILKSRRGLFNVSVIGI